MTAMAQSAQVQVQVQPYQPQQPVYVQQQVAPPPPQDAVAPNGQYVAPMQQQTQQTYVPQSVAMSGPRVIRDWHEGDPIPPGYHPSARIRGSLVGGGAGLFGGTYLVSLLVAAIGEDACSGSFGGTCKNEAAPLFIPVVGPFITMGNTDSATADVFLVVDGLAQAAGVAMFIYGLAVPKTVLVRNDLGFLKNVTAAPIVAKSFTGLGLTGQF
ncbi:MAG TPA: hypothetical protein VGH28_30670 [Polyangiaceae bacterium]